jgi:hypothetical protein
VPGLILVLCIILLIIPGRSINYYPNFPGKAEALRGNLPKVILTDQRPAPRTGKSMPLANAERL